MTIANVTSSIGYSGTGSQATFPYPFKIYAASDLKVYLKEAGSYTLKTLNIDYTVTGVGNMGGGNVIMGTAPTATQEVIIYREPPLLQSQQYTQGGPFPAESAEDSIDKIVLEMQGLKSKAVKSPMGLLDIELPLPAPSTNGLFLRWNSTGTALEAVTQSPTYAAGCPVEMINAKDYGAGTVSFATLQAAKAAIGSLSRRLYLAKGDWPIDSSFSLGSNITVVMERGAKFVVANGATLTINGHIEAGPYQIFSWTGTGAIDLSASPTQDIPLEWFGTIEAGATGGLTADNSPALSMALKSTSFFAKYWKLKTIRISKGLWRLATPIVNQVSADNVYIKGTGIQTCGFLIDVGSTIDAITLGTDSLTGTYSIEDVGFYGAANACKRGLVISSAGDVHVNNIDFWLGSVDYACWLENLVWLNGDISTRHSIGMYYYANSLGVTLAECAKGVKLTNSPASGGNNASELRVVLDGIGSDPPLSLTGSYANNLGPGNVMRITGSIENWASGSAPFYIDKGELIELDNLYCEGMASANGAIISNSKKIKINNFF